MDYLTQRRLQRAFQQLDAALASTPPDRIAASFATSEINRLLSGRLPREVHTAPGAIGIPSGVPSWMRSIITNQGIPLTGLANALNVETVVLSPMMGKSYGLQLTLKW